MTGRLLLLTLALLGSSCGGADGGVEAFRGPIQRVLEDPAAFHGKRVEVRAWYVERSDEQLLSSGLAESYPPQPVEPTVWISASEPEGDCLASDIGVTWGRVVATGTFHLDERGAFGPFGVLPMTLSGARLACP